MLQINKFTVRKVRFSNSFFACVILHFFLLISLFQAQSVYITNPKNTERHEKTLKMKYRKNELNKLQLAAI